MIQTEIREGFAWPTYTPKPPNPPKPKPKPKPPNPPKPKQARPSKRKYKPRVQTPRETWHGRPLLRDLILDYLAQHPYSSDADIADVLPASRQSIYVALVKMLGQEITRERCKTQDSGKGNHHYIYSIKGAYK